MHMDGEFKGPTHLSHRIGYQDGDQSAYSNDSIVYHQPFLRGNTVRKIDVDNDEIQYGSKPQFLKLIVAKQLQNAFINNLWNQTYLRKLHQLTSYQIQQADDLQIQTVGSNRQTPNFWNLIEVFTPYSKFIVIWGVFQILTYLLIFFWLPYKISFQTHTMSELFSDDQNESLEIAILIILALDVTVGINMAFIQKGQLIKTRKLIILHYLNQSAFVDLVSFFTVSAQFFIPNLSENNYMIFIQSALCFVFYILRIAKINRILASIQEFFNLSGYLNDLVGLLKVLMVIVGVVHIFGCIWHGIAFYNSSYSWLDAYDMRNKPNVSRYNVAIYWATMTMTTVGYGDITGKNDLELLVNNLTMFFGSIVFAYSVNSIGIFVSNMYKGTIEYSKTVSLINTFMSKNKIPFDLQTKIRSYLEYIWSEEQNMDDDEVGSIIDKLSKNLQEELQYQLRGNILKNCKMMVKLFSESFLKNLLHYMEEQSYSPEERIISMGEQDDCALYIITKGEVELIYEGFLLNEKVKRNSLKIYYQNESFGEYAFITGNKRTLTAISNGFTRVMKIKREHFLSIIKSYPDDYEKYCDVKDKSSLNDMSKLQINCFSCQSNNHMVDKCNFLHFYSDKDKVIKKEMYPVCQERKKIRRRINNHFIQNSLAVLKQITKSAKDFTTDLQNDCDEQDSHYQEEEDESNQNQIANFKSFTESMFLNMEINEQPQDGQRKSKQKSTMQTAGFGMAEENQDQQQKLNKYDTISSGTSSERQYLKQITPPKSPKITTTIQRPSVSNLKQIQKLYDNQKFHRKSIEQQTLQFVNQIMKSDVDINQNFVRSGQQKKTTMQNQTMIENQSNYLSLQTLFTKASDFDKMHSYNYYQPYFNVEHVLKRYVKVQKGFTKKKIFPEFSLYTFLNVAIRKGWKLRRLSLLAKAKTPLRRRQLGQSQRNLFFKDIN